MVNPIEGKIVIDVSRKYASIYRCDGNGKILDEDHFAFPYRLEPRAAVSEVVDAYAAIYDWLNISVNGSAREGDPPATTD